MNKEESLAFLQNCIDNINVVSDEEVAFLQEVYMAKCTSSIEESLFEVIPPLDIDECLFEIKEVMEIKIPDFKCTVKAHDSQWNYSMKGIRTNNQQSDGSLSYAA